MQKQNKIARKKHTFFYMLRRASCGLAAAVLIASTVGAAAVFFLPVLPAAAASQTFENAATVQSDIRGLLQSVFDSLGAEANFTVKGEELCKQFFMTDEAGNIQLYTDSSGNDTFQTTPLVQSLVDEQLMNMQAGNDNAYVRLDLENYQISCSASYYMASGVAHVTQIAFRYAFAWRDGASALAAKNAVIAHADQFLSSAAYPAGASETLRLRAIHHYICQTFQYDYRLFVDSEASQVNYTAYGMISDTGAIGGYPRGVCQAYAMYAYIMLRRAGFRSLTIDGVAGGGGHVWNLVLTSAGWYHIDFTWDDPISDGNPSPYTRRQSGAGVIDETYFLRTDSEIAVNHGWQAVQNGFTYPQTPSSRHPDAAPMPGNIPTQYNPAPTATPAPSPLPTKTPDSAAASSAAQPSGTGTSSTAAASSAGPDGSVVVSAENESSPEDSAVGSQPLIGGVNLFHWPADIGGLEILGAGLLVLAAILFIVGWRRSRGK